MKKTFEDFLENYFIQLNEYDGIPITKDNCEDMFDNWLEDLIPQDIIDYADLFGKTVYRQGKIDFAKELNGMIQPIPTQEELERAEADQVDEKIDTWIEEGKK